MVKTLLLALAAALLLAAPASAARHRHHHVLHRQALHHRAGARHAYRAVQAPANATDPAKDAAVIIDGATGKALYARNETAERHPASLTKMMTLYLLFEALRAHRITMQTQMPVSYHASVQKPTKLYLRPGQTISVDTAIRAIVIRSANDVAVVIAEALGGTEAHFAEMMTAKARQLGMRNTNYHNASGLPDPLQITTAQDLSILARHLAYDFPQYFPYFALAGFTYKGVYYPTHDNLIGHYPGADGIKTGFTVASGFNLASSVVRNGAHLIGIVMGGYTAVRRDREMMHLMDVQFARIDADPALVAHRTVPWQALASARPSGPSAAAPAADVGLSSAGYDDGRFAALSAVPPPPVPADADEDAAEAHRAPDERDLAVIHAEGSQVAPSRKAQPAVPPVIASAAPAARPALRTDEGEGDEDEPGEAVPGRNWTIQIGAYADKALAKAQLDHYAARSKDIVGQAQRLVVPVHSANGHTLYRARFGLYAEQEARDVCGRLTRRGQTCFAVITR